MRLVLNCAPSNASERIFFAVVVTESVFPKCLNPYQRNCSTKKIMWDLYVLRRGILGPSVWLTLTVRCFFQKWAQSNFVTRTTVSVVSGAQFLGVAGAGKTPFFTSERRSLSFLEMGTGLCGFVAYVGREQYSYRHVFPSVEETIIFSAQ